MDPNLDFLASIDMTQLHRCVHLHECLGKVQDFQVEELEHPFTTASKGESMAGAGEGHFRLAREERPVMGEMYCCLSSVACAASSISGACDTS